MDRSRKQLVSRRQLRWLVAVVAVVAATSVTSPIGASAVGGAPTTTVTGGPVGFTDRTSVQFTFSADEPGSFQCSLDGSPFAGCASPAAYGALALGTHRFSVRAINTAGVADASPPTRTWTIVPPLQTAAIRITRPASHVVRIGRFRAITGTAHAPSGVTFIGIGLALGGPNKNYFPPRCRFIDLTTGALLLQTCVLPPFARATGTVTWRYTIPATVRRRLKPGRYRLSVRALNGFGNATLQTFSLTIKR